MGGWGSFMTKEIMSFERCKKEFLRKADIDLDKVKSKVKMAELELKIIDKIAVNPNTASKLAKDYYEIIKELLSALLLAHGLKSSNHECLVSFFGLKYPLYPYETETIHTLKDIRNRVSYDGYFVDKTYIAKNKIEFNHIIKLLNRLVKESVPNMGQVD